MFDDSMGFLTYNDFFKRRKQIKVKFHNLKPSDRRIYRMYLYSNREMSTTKVDLIWEYLNEADNSPLCPTIEQLSMYFVEALEPKPTNKAYLEEESKHEY